MARIKVPLILFTFIVFYYLLGLWFDRDSGPRGIKRHALTPIRKYSQRIVAIGDLHGDVHHALRALKMTGLVNHRNNWIGKRAILGSCLSVRRQAKPNAEHKRDTVQTGDIVDRGKDTIALYHLFDQLREQAAAAGGAVVSLLGNHEYMNAMGDWPVVI